MAERLNASPPDTNVILAELKDFQRQTVEYVFQRLYGDEDHARRFLVADEVGLGKTLVARGVIAKTIEHLWERTPRIDVVYVCSNTDIARQNIKRMNVTGNKDFCLASRITLLPIALGEMSLRRVNFVSFTPGTSFELSQGAGQSLERALLYWLIANERAVSWVKATRLLAANAGVDSFREQVKAFPEAHPSPHPDMAGMFWKQLQRATGLLERFDALCDAMPRAGAAVPPDLHRERNRFIGELRRLLAESCLQWLEPDLIILDEFQRFKHLLEGDMEEPSEAAQLAKQLFNYQQSQGDSSTAARVLLLSATPYKMYTLAHEKEQDDHYADFERTLQFLMPSIQDRQHISRLIQLYREEVFSIAQSGNEALLGVKRQLEAALRRVMVRTERLAVRADRNGMLIDAKQTKAKLTESDVEQYLALAGVARALESADLLEYWKSAPYLLNFMERYDLKQRLLDELQGGEQSAAFVRAMRQASSGLLHAGALEKYRKLDPGNARLRSVYDDVISRGAWRLLWVSPSLPYFEPRGPFAAPELACFTKRLVFSCWRVVPKAIAAVLSYEAERLMIQTFQKKARNTAEARKKRRALLRFTFSKGRPTGMPALALVYPCQWLAERFDPLKLARPEGAPCLPLPTEQTLKRVSEQINAALADEIERAAKMPGPVDEAWYWAAPLLLDRRHHFAELDRWFAQPTLAKLWSGDDERTDDDESAQGWTGHVERARQFLKNPTELGPPPDDLCEMIANLALSGPGVACLRALARGVATDAEEMEGVRTSAASLAHSFLRLFNLPEVMAMLRDKKRDAPYWKSVLSYCMDGNLQAVLDEYSHILMESLGVSQRAPQTATHEISAEMRRCLTLRTSTAQADVLAVGSRRARQEEPIRLRTRFAMRFGDQDDEEGGEATRADHVRAAFNSPFWPFVLATTSVGQEGLDFHPYCHAVVHWNLPANPVDLEQREGRVHRYKGHALRKNIAASHGGAPLNGDRDIWAAMFAAARDARPPEQNDLFPFWVAPDGAAKIERHIPALPHSRDIAKEQRLRRSLVIYRMVFGQNRQEDLVRFLLENLPEQSVEQFAEACRLSLAPE